MEKAETVEIEDGGCGGTELDVGEDLGCALESASSFTASPLDIGEEAGCFGAAKKEVMVAFAFGFFESEPAASAAFRFKDVDILNIERMLAAYSSSEALQVLIGNLMGQSSSAQARPDASRD